MRYEPYKIVLEQLYEKTRTLSITERDRIVIFSDLHMGDGKPTDDFLGNSELFCTALKEYYMKKGFTLILNGDVEELHRYKLQRIHTNWEQVYRIFDSFFKEGRFYKILGNHDSKLFSFEDRDLRYPLHEALRLNYGENSLFLFHGHQVSFYYQKFNDLMGLMLRYFARPLRIKHHSVAHDKQKKYIIERRLYEFTKEKGMIAVIGHTHRPLFESMSRIDILNYEIENLLRSYHRVKKTERPRIEAEIQKLKAEVDQQEARKGGDLSISRIYSNTTLVPCVFNSGSVIGKRGITGIEISRGVIRLVHWFDGGLDKKYIHTDAKHTIRLEGTDLYRTILKKDDLNYIFTRIRLLT